MAETCLICDASGQDGFDSCALGTGIASNGTGSLLGIALMG